MHLLKANCSKGKARHAMGAGPECDCKALVEGLLREDAPAGPVSSQQSMLPACALRCLKPAVMQAHEPGRLLEAHRCAASCG